MHPSDQLDGHTAVGDKWVSVCPPAWRVKALQLLEAAQAESEAGEELAAAVDAMLEQPDNAWNGLLIVPGEAQPLAAVWVQPHAAGTARLWPPGGNTPAAAALLDAALRWAASRGIRLVQALVEPADRDTNALLSGNGFPPAVELLYLRADPRQGALRVGRNPAGTLSDLDDRRERGGTKRPFLRSLQAHSGDYGTGESEKKGRSPTRAVDQTQVRQAARGTEVTFESIGHLPSPRLESILAATKDQSLDCCNLHGILSAQDTIEAFRHRGQFTPEHWCLMRYRGEDVGILLLTPHPPTPCWELMYMGILPSWRGLGLGHRLLQEALLQARQAGAVDLLLSVDRINRPARHLYKRAGFSEYARRTLHAAVPPAAVSFESTD